METDASILHVDLNAFYEAAHVHPHRKVLAGRSRYRAWGAILGLTLAGWDLTARIEWCSGFIHLHREELTRQLFR